MVLVVIQILLVAVLVILILLQTPGSDSLSGFGASQSGLNSMFPSGSSSSVITKATGIVAAAFIINTLILVGLTSKESHNKSIADKIALEVQKNSQEGAAPSVPFNS